MKSNSNFCTTFLNQKEKMTYMCISARSACRSSSVQIRQYLCAIVYANICITQYATSVYQFSVKAYHNSSIPSFISLRSISGWYALPYRNLTHYMCKHGRLNIHIMSISYLRNKYVLFLNILFPKILSK